MGCRGDQARIRPQNMDQVIYGTNFISIYDLPWFVLDLTTAINIVVSC